MKNIRIPALTLAGLFLFAFGSLGSAAQEQFPPPAAEKVAGSLYQIRGGAGANTCFYLRDKDVVLIDIKMTVEGVQYELEEIKKVTNLPITTIILTHSDGDHVTGLIYLPREMRVIAHENVQRDLEKLAAKQPAFKDRLPIETYKESFTLEGGGKTILLQNFGPAHTDGDTVVFFPEETAALTGDLAFVGRDPLIHLSKNGSSFGYVKTLRAILEHKPEVTIFCSGHADPLDRARVEELAKSIEEKQAKVKALVKEGKSLDDVKTAFGIPLRPEHPSQTAFPSLAEVIYRELTEKK
ncbi:MAG: MBL fold metallo-hydrolase [Candidatus Aminicenantes bacterium]|nr:MBL fold metallo-hydrolase [Candidatus Aminicenantes bacterium]